MPAPGTPEPQPRRRPPGDPGSVVEAKARLLRRDAERTREAILEQAFRLLAERPRASLEEIAQAVGVNRSTIHRHFRRREDLVAALDRRVVGQIDDLHRECQNEGGTAAEQIECILRRIVLLGPRLRFFLEHWDPHMGTELFQTADSWTELVNQAQRDGLISAELPHEWITPFIASTHVLAIRLVDKDVLSVDEAANLATATIMSGLAPTGPRA